jgi:hypothetical protein
MLRLGQARESFGDRADRCGTGASGIRLQVLGGQRRRVHRTGAGQALPQPEAPRTSLDECPSVDRVSAGESVSAVQQLTTAIGSVTGDDGFFSQVRHGGGPFVQARVLSAP